MTDAAADEAKLRALREQIPATSAGIYLDTASRGPLPAETAAAMKEAEDWELRVGRVWDGRDDDVIQRHDEARAVLAALVGADVDAITVTPGLEAAAWLVERVLTGGADDIVRLVDPWTGALLRPSPFKRGGRVVDASLAVGALEVRADDLDADAVIFATDRWLMGPESLAAVWWRDPALATGMAVARTPLLGLARTVGWLEMYVALPWIYERTADLARRLHEALTAIDGVEVVTPSDALAAVVCFRLTAWPLEDAAVELRRRAFAIVGTSGDGQWIRASVAWFNTDEEIDRFAAATAEIARHTPESLPRRPQLSILH